MDQYESGCNRDNGEDTRSRINNRGTIIVISRNNLHLTKKAVASALAQDMPCDAILVDNASTDGTVKWALAKDGLATISFSSQKSLAYCWNFVLQSVSRQNAHVLVLNNDVEIRPDTYRLLESHKGPFVSCVSVDAADRLGKTGDRTLVDLLKSERLHPDFSCFMIRKECFETVGPFDEAYYPAYVEDCDYHVRMHRAGIDALCVDLPFLHHGAGTIKHADPVEKKIIERGADTNRQRFKRKYGCLPGTKEYEALFSSL